MAQALHDAPDIVDKIRVHWIGGPNKKWSTNSYTYIVENFPNLWMIENNASYRGFITQNKVKDRYNAGYYDAYIKGAGHLGADFINYYKGIPKMGDTPALLYVMNGNPDDPEGESWGGSFEPTARSDRSDIPADSACFTLTIGKQKWDGFHLGGGDYAVRHSTYYLGTLPYTITSDIPGFPALEGVITIENLWPGRESATDCKVGSNWYTDKSDPALFWRNLQGAETVYKWRQAVMEDWGKRLQYLKD